MVFMTCARLDLQALVEPFRFIVDCSLLLDVCCVGSLLCELVSSVEQCVDGVPCCLCFLC